MSLTLSTMRYSESCSGQDTSAASKTADGQHVSTVVQDRTRQPLPRRPMDSTYQQLDAVRDEKITNKEGRDGLFLERRHLADVGQDRQIWNRHAEAFNLRRDTP